MSPLLADLRWAQRSNLVHIKIDVDHRTSQDIKLTSNSLDFTAATESGATYHVTIEFFGEIDETAAKWKLQPRYVEFALPKKHPGTWDRLTKEHTKHHNIKIDWGLWVDEDDEEEGAMPFDMGDFSNLPGGGGMPNLEGLGGDDDDDDDDEDDAVEMGEAK